MRTPKKLIMDGVIAFFRGVSPAQLESELQALQRSMGRESFVFFMYGEGDWRQELETAELDDLVQRLGEPPSAAASIFSRRGSAAMASLTALLRLIEKFPVCVIDDDFGAFWSPDDLRALAATAPVEGLFGLRGWTGPGV